MTRRVSNNPPLKFKFVSLTLGQNPPPSATTSPIALSSIIFSSLGLDPKVPHTVSSATNLIAATYSPVFTFLLHRPFTGFLHSNRTVSAKIGCTLLRKL